MGCRTQQSFSLLSKANVRLVFDGYFLCKEKFRVHSMSNIAFNCFKTMFVTRNVEEGILKQERDKLITLKEDVRGTDRLWDMTFECTDKEVYPRK